MKEEKLHLYRIDPLKVKQKLYSLYPQGSPAHAMMAKEEKIKEYTQLVKTVSSMPVEVVKEMADENKMNVLKLTLKSLGLFTLGFGCTSILLFSHTQLELILAGILMLVCFSGAFRQFLLAARLAYSIKNFEDAFKKTKDRLEKLQKDIFE